MINKFFSKKKKTKPKVDIKIAILFYIPKSNTEKYNNWTDGFTKGINIIEKDYDVSWINIEDEEPTIQKLNGFDFIIAKCCWNSKIDNYLKSLKGLKTPCGIAISCSIIPQKKQADFYKILWYETFWYKQKLPKHKNTIHAFGVNSSDFKYQNFEKSIDVLSIGALTKYKRHDKLINFPGKNKIVIGDTNYNDSEEVIKKLKANNIDVLQYTCQKDLSTLINKAKTIYIACELNGGGERAVLESRLCNVNVVIENDNPKLKELISSPIWDEKHYGNQIKTGIEKFLNIEDDIHTSNLITSTDKIKANKNSFHNGNLECKGDEFISIGAYCSFGKNVSIITSNHDTNFIATQGYVYRKNFKTNHPGEVNIPKSKERTKGPIYIGNDVWIGDDVKILSGVTIGNGACIGSGTIVTKNIKPYEIHVGTPNKKIKLRFPQEVCDFLQEVKWWDWSDKKIKNNQTLFNLNLNSTPIEKIKNSLKP